MDYSNLLIKAYNQYLLPLGGKKVPAPYRINIPFQPDRKIDKNIIYLGGKSPAKRLTEDTILAAKEQNFDLEKSSVEEIQKFMQENMLGIDCSGFTYHLLDFLLRKIKKGGMEKIGFPKASQTDVEKLTSREFAEKLENIRDGQPGDIIRLGSKSADLIQHCIIILETSWGMATYAHSSRKTLIKGVHTDSISLGKLPPELKVYNYSPEDTPDGLYRLKALNTEV